MGTGASAAHGGGERGYELRLRPDAVDVAGFERLAEAAARGQGSGTEAREALSLWRGRPLIDVIDEPFAAPELRRLEDLWLNVTEQAIAADIEAGRHDQTVARVRADGSESVIHLGSPPSAIAAGAGSVWVASDETGTLFRVEPRTGTVAKAIRVGNRPVAVAAGESGVWVVNRQDATVWRVDPGTVSVTDTIAVGRDPGAAP